MRKLCIDLARFVGSSALSLLESGLRKHCCLAIPDRRAFVQHYDSDVLDASLLLMPLCKFIAPTDPRWISTLDSSKESSHTPSRSARPYDTPL
jgi:GH15 family glucan-1,4-alpha-glucosidase